jgi:LysM repeat protein
MTSIEHTVEQGETLFQIGKQHGINWRIIGHYNNLENLNTIHAGQKILIPTSTKGLSSLVDNLHTWFSTKDPTDVTAIGVELEHFARDPQFSQEELHKWATENRLPDAEEVAWEFYAAGKLTTLSWFIGEYVGEWRKYVTADTK